VNLLTSNETALIVVDVINTFEHEDAEALLASFRERVEAMERAIEHARENGIPVIYANDANGDWDGDAPRHVRRAIDGSGGDVVRRIAPRNGDLFFFKPRYSAFDQTPLRQVLSDLDIGHIQLAGAATEGCVVQTGIDAREQGLKVTILARACATADGELEELALGYAEKVGGMRVDNA
jgi:nicotinamidase-related amidase